MAAAAVQFSECSREFAQDLPFILRTGSMLPRNLDKIRNSQLVQCETSWPKGTKWSKMDQNGCNMLQYIVFLKLHLTSAVTSSVPPDPACFSVSFPINLSTHQNYCHPIGSQWRSESATILLCYLYLFVM